MCIICSLYIHWTCWWYFAKHMYTFLVKTFVIATFQINTRTHTHTHTKGTCDSQVHVYEKYWCFIIMQLGFFSVAFFNDFCIWYLMFALPPCYRCMMYSGTPSSIGVPVHTEFITYIHNKHVSTCKKKTTTVL